MGRRKSSFLLLWTMAVAASTAAFCVFLTLRVRAIEMGYELGRVHGQLGRLREVRRVLELEVASYQTPERVDLVARTLLGMAPPGADRMFRGRALPKVLDAERQVVSGGSFLGNTAPGSTAPAAAAVVPSRIVGDSEP